MKIHLDCLSCILRQVLEASRMATDDEALQKKVMAKAIGLLKRFESYPNSPEIVGDAHKIVKDITGIADPYSAIKERDIQQALRILPGLKQYINGREDALYWALKAAAVGNVLDSAISTQTDVAKNLEEEIDRPFAICDMQIFTQRLKDARSILVIGDNAGETVFDTILLEKLFLQRVYYAVRGAAVINDATADDAEASGVARYGTIISTGCDAPGLLLHRCSPKFLDLFYDADIVISKGQGNYETLSECDRDIYFLLKAKCPVLSKAIGVELSDYIFQYNKPEV